MARLIYSAISSLDGYVADEQGKFDWAEPNEEVHIDLDLIFCQANGKPLHAHNIIRRDFHRVLELRALRAGLQAQGVAEGVLPKPLPRIRFHDLRHCHATLLLQQGVHPKIVQERLGHSQVGITMDTYSHVLPGVQAEAVQKLQKRLFGVLAT